MSMGLLEYERAMAAIIVILVLVIFCLKISDTLRKRIIGQEVLQ